MAGASGARSWLQAHHPSWLTDQRLRRATVALFVVATIAGTTRMSGSGAAPEHPSTNPPSTRSAALHEQSSDQPSARTATSYLPTDERWPGVSSAGIALSVASARL